MYSIPYIILFCFLLFLYKRESKIKKNNILSFSNRKEIKRIEYTALISYLIFYGLRGYIFTDCFQYHRFFESVDFSVFKNYLEYLFEPGYIFANLIIRFFTKEAFVFQFIWVLIDVILLHKILKRETKEYFLLSFALLIPFFDGVQINLFRNIKAILIFFWAIQYIRERKLTKYIISILIASSFHLTAILYIPIYFIINRNVHKLLLISSLFAITFYFIGLGGILNIFFSIAGSLGGKFVRITEAYINSAVDAGFTFGFIFRLFLLSSLLILYKKLSTKNIIFLNLAIIYLILNIAFNSITVLRDRLSTIFIIGLVGILPYTQQVIKSIKIRTQYFIIVYTFLLAQVFIQHKTIVAQYTNLITGIENIKDAEYRVFNNLE